MADLEIVQLPQQCFAIFEGGGAKGITHLGALKALEDVKLERIGAAGTSAGAIIAALTAVGYSADELFKSGADNILVGAGLTPIDLLGVADWTVFSAIRGSSDNEKRDALFETRLRQLVLFLAGLIPPLLSLVPFCLTRTIGWPKRLMFGWRILDNFGFFSTESARDILNDLLRRKLGLEEGTLVRFGDMDPELHPSCCRLKIITTNLVRKGLELFDHTTPDVVVADAVAASFSIPLFFKPTRIRCVDDAGQQSVRPDSYADGGLVSNLPVWVFFEDKKGVERSAKNRMRRPIPIVAFQLVEQPKTTKLEGLNVVRTFLAHLGEVLRTGIFGGQSIAENFVTHLTIVELPTKLGVVQFDCDGPQALEAFDSGRAAAAQKLKTVLRDNPTRRTAILQDLVQEAEGQSALVRRGPGAAFRACVVRRLGTSSFKVVASVNMERDTDDDLVLDQNNPAAPTAFKDKDMTYVDLRRADTDLRMTKYEAALVRATLSGVISVPIFKNIADWTPAPSDRDVPCGVMCIDSDMPLDQEYADPAFLKILIEKAVELAPYMTFEKETS